MVKLERLFFDYIETTTSGLFPGTLNRLDKDAFHRFVVQGEKRRG